MLNRPASTAASRRPARRARSLVEPFEPRLLFASIAVLNTADRGEGSLRAAVEAAVAGDTISLTSLSGTIALDAPIAIDKSLTILGPGTATLTISGSDHATTAFTVGERADVAISDLTIDRAGTANGSGAIVVADVYDHRADPASLTLDRVDLTNNVAFSGGGAIRATHAALTLRDCNVVNNVAAGGGSVAGGAISVEHALGLTIERTTFADNVARGTSAAWGGAIFVNADALVATPVVVRGSTFANNAATVATNETSSPASEAVGGGAWIYSLHGIAMANNTFAGNAASGGVTRNVGGGLSVRSGTGVVALSNNLLATNVATDAPDLALDAEDAATAFNNLVGDGAGSNLTHGANANLVGTALSPIDARLAPIAANGGATRTMALLDGSPAINAGSDVDGLTTDQRGLPRVSVVDIGAYESQASIPVIRDPSRIDLVVNGTEGNDEIQVWTRLRGAQLRVVVNGKIRNYDRALVRSITVLAQAGNDVVTINADTLGADVSGGAGDDTIFGGAGDDTIAGNGGSDRLYGGAGNDLLRGNGGADKLFGDDGDDRLFGGENSDTLDGGAGNDRLDGEAGTDFYIAADGFADRLIGLPADDDRALSTDADDELFDVLPV